MVMMQGWLTKRKSPQGGTMERRFCVLIGVWLVDYEAKRHYLNGLPPVAEAEIIGVSSWDGRGRSHAYDHGLVYVTRLGTTYFSTCDTAAAKAMWMGFLRHAVVMSVSAAEAGNVSSAPLSSSSSSSSTSSTTAVVAPHSPRQPPSIPSSPRPSSSSSFSLSSSGRLTGYGSGSPKLPAFLTNSPLLKGKKGSPKGTTTSSSSSSSDSGQATGNAGGNSNGNSSNGSSGDGGGGGGGDNGGTNQTPAVPGGGGDGDGGGSGGGVPARTNRLDGRSRASAELAAGLHGRSVSQPGRGRGGASPATPSKGGGHVSAVSQSHARETSKSPAPSRREAFRRDMMEAPPPIDSDVCAKSGVPFKLTQSRYVCVSCGATCAYDFCNKEVPLVQYGMEEKQRVCDDCFLGQQFLSHLKFMEAMFEAHIHEHRRARQGQEDAVRRLTENPIADTEFGASSLQTGMKLLSQNLISRKEFSELVKAEQLYLRDEAANRVHTLWTQVMMDVGDDLLSLIKLMHDSAHSQRFSIHEFEFIVMHLHHLAEHAAGLDAIDFFWPQIIHTYYLMVPASTLDGILKAELLEDFLLAMGVKSVHLAVKLIWWVNGYLEDLSRKGLPLVYDDDSCGKQVNLIRLAMEVEESILNSAQSMGYERRVFRSQLMPTGAQSSLIADQLLKLQYLRRIVGREFFLGFKLKLNLLNGYNGSTSPGPWGVTQADSEAVLEQRRQSARYFEEQLAFVHALTSIAERLRFVLPVENRKHHLVKELEKLEGAGKIKGNVAPKKGDEKEGEGTTNTTTTTTAMSTDDSNFSPTSPIPSRRRNSLGEADRTPGYLPVCQASSAIIPIVRIPMDEGHVFRTKERAPTLIVCEVIRPVSEEMRAGEGAAERAGEGGAVVDEVAGERGEEEALQRSSTSTGETASKDNGHAVEMVNNECEPGETTGPINTTTNGTPPTDGGHPLSSEGITKIVVVVDGGGDGGNGDDFMNAEDIHEQANGQPPPPLSSPLQGETAGSSSSSTQHHHQQQQQQPKYSHMEEVASMITADGQLSQMIRTERQKSAQQEGSSGAIGGGGGGAGGGRGGSGDGIVVKQGEGDITAQASGGEDRNGHAGNLEDEQQHIESNEAAGGAESSTAAATDLSTLSATNAPVTPIGTSISTSTLTSALVFPVRCSSPELVPVDSPPRLVSPSRRHQNASQPPSPAPSPSLSSLPLAAQSGVTPSALHSAPNCAQQQPATPPPRLSEQQQQEQHAPPSPPSSPSPRQQQEQQQEERLSCSIGEGDEAGEGDGANGKGFEERDEEGGGVGEPTCAETDSDDVNGAGGQYWGAGEHESLQQYLPGIDGEDPIILPPVLRSSPRNMGASAKHSSFQDVEEVLRSACAQHAIIRNHPDLGGSSHGGNSADLSADSSISSKSKRRGSNSPTTSQQQAALQFTSATAITTAMSSSTSSQPSTTPNHLPPSHSHPSSAGSLASILPAPLPPPSPRRSRSRSPTVSIKGLGGGGGSGGSGAIAELTEISLDGDDDDAVDDIDLHLHTQAPVVNGNTSSGGGGGGGEGAGSAAAAAGGGGGTGGGGGAVSGRGSFYNRTKGGGRAKSGGSGSRSSVKDVNDVLQIQQREERVNKVQHLLQLHRHMGVSDAVEQAKNLFLQKVITVDELETVIKTDRKLIEVIEEHAFLDVQFCVAQAFGESWESKRARIQSTSPMGKEPGWDLVSIIIKSNDDLRQEVCAIQLIDLCRRIFREAQLDLRLEPYLIISTGASTGLLQTLTNTASLDSLKKKPDFPGLKRHFEVTYGSSSEKSFQDAQWAFAMSLAAYSLVCHIFLIKDRHNGNILLTTEGNVIHIDFGFILGSAPGGSFSLETCPFKFTQEMVEVMGGLESKLFKDFVVAFTCGFLALQQHANRIVTLVELMCDKSPLKCFLERDPQTTLKKLKQRLVPHLNKSQTVLHCLDLIRESYNNYNTRQYDNFQWLSNGIMP